MIERADPATVTVTIYHQCIHAATGSALGPCELVSYWWAAPSGIRVVGDVVAVPEHRAEVEQAIQAALASPHLPGAVVRAAQDADGESVL